MKMNSIFILLILIMITCVNPAIASQTTTDSAVKTWDEFVAALRSGNMPDAYAKLSKSSQQALSYRDFCVEWHPIGIKYNTVLSNPGYSNFSIFGNIATVKIGLDPELNPDNKSGFIRIILEEEDSHWSVVAEKMHTPAIRRASITGVLKDIVNESRVLNTAFSNGKGSVEEIVAELPRIFTSERGKLALDNYNFELDLLRDGVLRAIPRQKNTAGYQIDQQGIITTFIPSQNRIITSEDVQRKREQDELTRKKAALARKEAENKRLAARDIKQKQTVKSPRRRPENRELVQNSTLPDLPPDFPMDFTDVQSDEPCKTSQRRINFIKPQEDFDLPEIDNFDEIIGTEASEDILLDTGVNNTVENTQTMAGDVKGGELHTTSVELTSESLLEELELMVEEFEETNEMILPGGTDDN